MQKGGKQFRAIAIDGPAASGKSTVARMLSEQLDLAMVNTGAMYRAVAWEVVRRERDPRDEGAVKALLGELDVVCGIAEGISTISIDGNSDEEALRSPEVNAAVSAVAAISEVRELLVAKQRELLQIGDLVMEGRDIGSVVFPETPYKFYIHASEEVRMKRRKAEGVSDVVGQRDREDSQRKASPLVVADGAIVIDSSEMTIEEVVAEVRSRLHELGWVENEMTSV